jgi:hypothetical protein
MNHTAKIIYPLFGFLSYAFVVNAQIRIQGTTEDVKGKIIEYVSIGFENKGIGTVSNRDGIFSLIVPDSLKNELVTFSHIGYITKRVLPGEITGNRAIILDEKINELSGITVLPSKISSKWLKKGLNVRLTARITAPESESELGGDWGISWNIKKKCLLKQVRFKVTGCSYDSVVVSINICRFNSSAQTIGDSYLQKPLYKTIFMNKKSKQYSIDIPENIQIDPSEVFISLGSVQFYGKGNLNLKSYIGTGYFRETSLAKLEKMPFSPNISILVHYY